MPNTEQIILRLNCSTYFPTVPKERLEKFGIMKYFNLVISSAEEGIAKPDPKIFDIAVCRANTYADRCVMIGDRLDNDIIPAKNLGFKTVWVRQGFSRFVPAVYGGKWADIIFENIEDVILLRNFI